jgi:hypothetical protein
MGELFHQLSLWLESQGRSGAVLHPSGAAQFEPRLDLVAWADMLSDGRIELFCCPGCIPDAYILSDESQTGGWLVVDQWASRGADWRVAIQGSTGRVLLSCLVPLPFEFSGWNTILRRFIRYHDSCRRRAAALYCCPA